APRGGGGQSTPRLSIADLVSRLDGADGAPTSAVPSPPSGMECLREYLRDRELHPEEGDAGAQERLLNRYDWDQTQDVLKVLLRGAEEYERDGGRGLRTLEGEWRSQLRRLRDGYQEAERPTLAPLAPQAPPGLTASIAHPFGGGAPTWGVGPAPATSPAAPRPLLPPGAPAASAPLPSLVGRGRTDLYHNLVGPILADGTRHAPPGERRAGVGGEIGPTGDSEMAAALKDIGLGIESLVKHNSESKSSKGTPQGLGREETALVFLARACNRFNVQVCPSYTGTPLYQAIKEAFVTSKGELSGLGWPTCVTSRLALGLAGLYFGARDQHSLLPHYLSVADFPKHSQEEHDNHVVPQDDRLEARPRAPATLAQWVKQAQNHARCFALIYGWEHYQERADAIEKLEKLAEEDSDVFPRERIYGWFEELNWRWREDLKDVHRQLLRISGKEWLRKEQLEFMALTPDSDGNPLLRMPTCFKLDLEDAWFRKTILPHLERQHSRTLWRLTHKALKAPGDARGAGAEPGAEGSPRRAYPAGKRLPPREAAESVTHAPIDEVAKKPYCWGAATHCGCQRTAAECGHSHRPFKGALQQQHWTVQAQLIRRGGLKGDKPIPPTEVDGRIKQLREAAHEEAAQKELVSFAPTAAENELTETLRGPDYDWERDVDPPGPDTARVVEDTTAESPEDVGRRREQIAKIASLPEVGPLEQCSHHLQSYVKGRLLHSSLRGEDITVEGVLDELVRGGPAALAEEAGDYLDQLRRAGGAHLGPGSGYAEVLQPTWPADGGRGIGKLLVAGLALETADYRDSIHVSPGLREALQLGDQELEERQCMVIHIAAGLLDIEATRGDAQAPDAAWPPPTTDTLALAADLREELWAGASEATRALGETPEKLDRAEREVRGYIHDVLHPHHNKDYRSLCAFPLEPLSNVIPNFIRVDSLGRVNFESVSGAAASPESPNCWLLIHRRHMRLIKLGPDIDRATLLADFAQHASTWGGSPPTDYVAMGWEVLLDQAKEWAPEAFTPQPRTCLCCKYIKNRQEDGARVAGDVAPLEPLNDDYTFLTIAGWGLQAWSPYCRKEHPIPESVTVPGDKLIAQEIMDDPTARYRKRTWIVARASQQFARWIAKRCCGQHRHVSLEGHAPGSAIRRCRTSQVYPWPFVENLTQGILAGVLPGGLRTSGCETTDVLDGGEAPPLASISASSLDLQGGMAQEPRPPDDSARRVGDSGEARALIRRFALAYVAYAKAQPTGTVDAWRGAAARGEALVELAGSVEEGARALFKARSDLGLDNLKGIFDSDLDRHLAPDALLHLRDQAGHGVAARDTGIKVREECKPHQSAADVLDQCYEGSWKDVHAARVLVLPRRRRDLLQGARSSPQGAVPKQNPDRTLSLEKRLIHDQRRANETTDKTWHPPAAQPFHRQLARLIVWWSVKLPRIPILLSKLDVKGAFKLLWVDPQDVGTFATDLPWHPEACSAPRGPEEAPAPQTTDPDTQLDQQVQLCLDRGLAEGLTLISLVLTFGWAGSPGEWTPWGDSVAAVHSQHAPGNSAWEGPFKFQSYILMDDLVLVEPALGMRPWTSRSLAEKTIEKLLGPAAVNQDKKHQEGYFSTNKIVWGLEYRTDEMQVAIPEPRLLKGAYLLSDTCYDSGYKGARLRDMQVLRGTGPSWMAAMPALATELRAVDAFLTPQADGILRPKVEPGAEEAAWQDLWDTCELLRLLLARPEVWGERFTVSMYTLLDVRERLALPGEAAKVVWVTADATTSVAFGADWTEKIYLRQDLKDYKGMLGEALGDSDDSTVEIALGEAMAYIVLAGRQGPSWSGRIVLLATDNMAFTNWLKKRHPRPRLVRHLFRILHYLECKYNFMTIGHFFRTYHNVTADFGSRASQEEVKRRMDELGLSSDDAAHEWADLVANGVRRRVLRLLGGDAEDGRIALQLREARLKRRFREVPLATAPGRALEWGLGAGFFSKIWTGLGGTAHTAPIGEDPDPSAGPVWAILATLGPDPTGRSACKAARQAARLGAQRIALDAPRQLPLGEAARSLQEQGFTVSTEDLLATEVGELVARRRALLLGTRHVGDEQQAWTFDTLDLRRPIAPAVGPVLQPPSALPPDAWLLHARFEADPRMRRAEDRLLPVGVGHLWSDKGREVVYSTGGPLPTIQADWTTHPPPLIRDFKGPGHGVRRVTLEESWLAVGGTLEDFPTPQDDATAAHVTRLIAGDTGARLAGAIALWAGAALDWEASAGACFDLDAQAKERGMREWLARWRQGLLPGRPPPAPLPHAAPGLPPARPGEPGRHAGGSTPGEGADRRPPTRCATFRPADGGIDARAAALAAGLVWQDMGGTQDEHDAARAAGASTLPEIARPPRKQKMPQLGLVSISAPEHLVDLAPDVPVFAEVQEWVHKKLASGLAHSTRTSYGEAWSKWLWWCTRRGIPPLFEGDSKRQVTEDEEELLRFIGYLGWLGKGNGTILSTLFALQGGHVRAGGGDPLVGKKRIKVLIDSLQKGGPKEERKLGVTPRMMIWLKKELSPTPPCQGERATRGPDFDSVVLWGALCTGFFYLCRAKEIVDSGGVDEQMCLRGVDVAFHDKEGGAAAPGVGSAAKALITFRKTKTDQRAFGACRTHHRAEAEVCPVEALELLRLHAPERFQEGSEGRRPLFRWASGRMVKREQLQAVKRWGRWSSNAFHGYLYDSEEQSRGVAAAMARDVATLHAVATPSMLWPQTPTTPFAMGMMPPWPEVGRAADQGALQGPPGGGGGALASASAAADALFAAAVAATTRQHAATAGSLAAQVPQASRRQRSRRHSARAPPGQARSPAAAATRPPRARRGRCCTTAASAAARAHGTTSRRGASSRPPARTATRARRASSRGARRPRSRRCARASLSPRLPPLERSGQHRTGRTMLK
ncbi:unnamed protein product, partial [Prorocentrum cordatum]